MRSIKLSKALTSGKVMVRTGRKVTGSVILKFRHKDAQDRLIMPYPMQDIHNDESYINLSRLYSAEQLMASNIEDLILTEDLELK
jgi:hypothetical protein